MADLDCTEASIESPPSPISIVLPGGVEFVSMPLGSSIISTELTAVTSVMAQLGPALGALQPVLRIIDAVIAVFDVVKAVPEIPVDPTGFFEALVALTEKMARLAPLVPQLSVPLTISSTVSALAKFARGIVTQLEQIGAAQAAALATLSAAQAAGDTALVAQAQCAADNADALLEHAGAAMGPLNNVMSAVTGLMSFIPSPVELPGGIDPAGMTTDQLIAALDALASTLEALTIPGT